MNIVVIGSGYVGLVTGACFSEFGFQVTCVDKDQDKIDRLKQGIIPIFEPGLDQLVKQNVSKGTLSFTTDLAGVAPHADVIMIAVGTPSRAEDGEADLSAVWAVGREIAPYLSGYTVVVTKSTVPAGTGKQLLALLKEHAPSKDFDVVSNPEFLREGSALEDFMRPDRVVIGVTSDRAREVMRRLYDPLYLLETPIVFTSVETAELIKYATNAFLATKITFINQMADLCEQCDGNVQEVARAMGLDRRIGSKFLHASPGYGGSCFPKDTLALTKLAQKKGVPFTIVESVVSANIQRRRKMVDKISRVFEARGGLSGKKLAVLGVTFKPNTDDMRDAPSLDILPALQQLGAEIRAYDPVGRHTAEPLLPAVSWASSSFQAMDGADAVVILTEWNEFRALDLEDIKKHLISPVLIDLRNIYKLSDVARAGLEYHSVGRPSLFPAA